MVNHIRTLLLNETQTSLQQAGLAYGDPWLVSPRFSGVEVPHGLLPVHDGIFSGVETLQDRIARVDAVASILAAKDMRRYVDLFDRRVTVPLARCASSVLELYSNRHLVSEGFEAAILDGAKGSTGLYAAVGNYVFDVALRELQHMASESFEQPLRVSAIVLAYCAQLNKLFGGDRG